MRNDEGASIRARQLAHQRQRGSATESLTEDQFLRLVISIAVLWLLTGAGWFNGRRTKKNKWMTMPFSHIRPTDPDIVRMMEGASEARLERWATRVAKLLELGKDRVDAEVMAHQELEGLAEMRAMGGLNEGPE